MAKQQTRRSVSVKGITYQRLKDYCDATGKSVSGYLEDIVAEKLDAEGVPMPTELRPWPQKAEAELPSGNPIQPKPPLSRGEAYASSPAQGGSQHFTF